MNQENAAQETPQPTEEKQPSKPETKDDVAAKRRMLQDMLNFAAPIYDFIAKLPKTNMTKMYVVGLTVAMRSVGDSFEISKPLLTLEGVRNPEDGEILYRQPEEEKKEPNGEAN